MPTGYTSFIEDGKVKTAKQFLHLCLRNFGVCIMMRDDSLELKDDYTNDLLKSYQGDIDYHKKHLKDAQKELERIQQMSEEELCSRYVSETTKNIEYYMKQNNQQNGNLAEYLRIKEGIEKWNCDEKFKSIKEFALNQIDISMDKSDYYEEALQKCGEPTREGFLKVKDEYIKKIVDHVQWDVDYHTKELESAIRRRDENIAFYKEFKESIANL